MSLRSMARASDSMSGDLDLPVVRKGRTGKPSWSSASILGSPMLLASAQMIWGFQRWTRDLSRFALQAPADLIKAVEGGHFALGDIDDGDGGVVLVPSPVDAGDVGVARLGTIELAGGDGVGDAAEDESAGVGELCQVFDFPDALGGAVLDVVQFGGINEGVVGSGEMEGLPVGDLGVFAELKEVVEPIGTVWACSRRGRRREW